MRPKPISREKREEVIVHMAAALLGAYEYFREVNLGQRFRRNGQPSDKQNESG
jgi:hypothetical protein